MRVQLWTLMIRERKEEKKKKRKWCRQQTVDLHVTPATLDGSSCHVASNVIAKHGVSPLE